MNLEPMWATLEKYQPYAEKRGFGAEWLRMTTERTEKAAVAARASVAGMLTVAVLGADRACAVCAAWAYVAADAGAAAAKAQPRPVDAAYAAERAIAYINNAIEQENKV